VGNRLEEDSPRNTYRTRDGKWVALSASSDRTFRRLVEAIGSPDLATDPRFDSNPRRIENADELDDILASWFAARDAGDALSALEAHDVVAGKVYDIEDIFADVHYAARECIAVVADPDFGAVKMPGVVPRFGESPLAILHTGRELGADNDYVYRELLSLTPSEIADLTEAGVI
jgi:crotonobetainyl-CoA:carnitine CoA-transferase CaiB-like acyl-CoA transferase